SARQEHSWCPLVSSVEPPAHIVEGAVLKHDHDHVFNLAQNFRHADPHWLEWRFHPRTDALSRRVLCGVYLRLLAKGGTDARAHARDDGKRCPSLPLTRSTAQSP